MEVGPADGDGVGAGVGDGVGLGRACPHEGRSYAPPHVQLPARPTGSAVQLP